MSDRGRSTAQAHAAGALTLGALGVVFGDIGTSPLYALHVAFSTTRQAGPPGHDVVYGVVSLVFWTITLVVTVKYVALILRADNEGEGGVLALLALIRGAPRPSPARAALLTLGLFGAALFYGDGMITPAVSVLSAVEGLRIAEPGLDPYVLPVALAVLIVLFGVQRFGTGTVGWLFGPVMALWFASIGVAGLQQVARHPEILTALSPAYGVRYLLYNAGNALVMLGAVALTVTGAEALYADMGHFGRPAVRRAWLCIAFPALVLNYAGQGALVLSSHGAAAGNPFFLMVPSWSRLPMVALATAATVIASQAVISGAFSITHQATQLGLLPRLRIRHTSERQAGQVYVPAVNAVLGLAVIALVVGFGSSERLASAYGIAVTGTMMITTILFFDVVRARWGKPFPVVLAGGAALLSVDVALFAASLTKLPHGGWLPLGVALGVFTVLTTFSRGRVVLERVLTEQEGSLRRFVEEVRAIRPPIFRPPQTSVFLHGRSDTAPLALRANLQYNHVVHRSVLIVLVETASVPHVAPSERVTVDDLGYRDDGIITVTARFGFHDRQDVPTALDLAAHADVEAAVDVGTASYFMSRFAIVATDAPTMRRWRKHLFIAMWRNQGDSAGYLGLPDERTVIMGSMVEL